MEKPNYYAIIPAPVRYDNELRPNEKLLYGEITALCGVNGYCWSTNQYFADLYGVTIRVVREWISHLRDRGYVNLQLIYKEGTKEVQERRIYIVPIGNVRADPPEEIFPTSGKKVPDPSGKKVPDPGEKKFLENNTRVNITSMNNNISSPSDDGGQPDEFEELWKLYPRKEGKKQAYAAYKRAIKNGTKNEDIRKGIENYVEQIRIKGRPIEYIKQGSTYFRNEHWTDVLDMTDTGGSDPFDIRNQYWDENDPTVH